MGTSAYDVEAITEMGIPADQARAAQLKYPNSIEAAINWCFSGEWTPSLPPPLSAPVKSVPSNIGHAAVSGAPPFAITPATEGPPPLPQAADTWKTIPAHQNPALYASQPSETISPYFPISADINVPTQPSNSVTNNFANLIEPTPKSPPPSRPEVIEINDEDDDLKKAMAASLLDAPSTTAGWSSTTGSWGGDIEMSGPSNNTEKSVVLKEPTTTTVNTREEEELQSAIRASLEGVPPRTERNNSPDPIELTYEETLSKMDQLRSLDSGAPVLLRTSSAFLGALPSLLQALYASKPFRTRLLEMKLPQTFSDPLGSCFDFNSYWEGKQIWTAVRTNDDEEAIAILASLQRLFVYMQGTKRKVVNVEDVVNALGIQGNQQTMMNPVSNSDNWLDKIFHAWAQVAKALPEEESRLHLLTCIPNGVHWDYSTDTPNIGPAYGLRLTIDPPSINDLYSGLDSDLLHFDPEHTLLNLVAENSATLILRIQRRPWTEKSMEESFGMEKKVFKLEEQIFADRYDYSRRQEILGIRSREVELKKEREALQAKKALLSVHQGKDMFVTLKSTINYYEKIATPKDEDHGIRQEAMRIKLKGILEMMEIEVATINEKLEANQTELDNLFAGEEWKQSSPYLLDAVTMHDGVPGKEHVFVYFKALDGQWYKSVNNKLDLTTFESAAKDTSGLHMRGGAYTMVYTSKEAQESDRPNLVAPEFLNAINVDNHAFQSIYPEEITKDWNLPPLIHQDSTMDAEQVCFPSIDEEEPAAVDIRLDDETMEEASTLPSPLELLTGANQAGQSSASASNHLSPLGRAIEPAEESNILLASTNIPVQAPHLVLTDTSAPVENYRSPNVQPSSPEKTAATSPESAFSSLAPSQSPPPVQETSNHQEDLISSDEEGDITFTKENNIAEITRAETLRLRGGHGHEDEYDSDDNSETSSAASKSSRRSNEVFLGILEERADDIDLWSMSGLIGGTPLFPNPTWPLRREDLICVVCNRNQAMRLLCQLSAAPVGDNNAAFRFLFIFACDRASCLAKDATKSIKVLRYQLPKDNPYRPSAPPDTSSVDVKRDFINVVKIAQEYCADQGARCCAVCGLAGPSVCSQCRLQHYCSEEHQKLAWKYHKASCKKIIAGEAALPFSIPKEVSQKVVWPAWQLEVEPEPGLVPLKRKHLLEHGNRDSDAIVIGDQEEEDSADTQEPETNTAAGSTFLNFQDRLVREPEQVVRYYRNSDKGEDYDDPPILLHDDVPPVPNCQHCGAHRSCEMQLMPNVLNNFNIDHSAEDSFDFGTILIYTCSQNCLPPISPAMQDFFASTLEAWRPIYGWANEIAVCQMHTEEEVVYNDHMNYDYSALLRRQGSVRNGPPVRWTEGRACQKHGVICMQEQCNRFFVKQLAFSGNKNLMDLPDEVLEIIFRMDYQDVMQSTRYGIKGFGAGGKLCSLALLHRRLRDVSRRLLYSNVILNDKPKYDAFVRTLSQWEEDVMIYGAEFCWQPLRYMSSLQLIGKGKTSDAEYDTLFRILGGHLQRNISLRLDYHAMQWCQRVTEAGRDLTRRYEDLLVEEVILDFESETSGVQPGHALPQLEIAWSALVELCHRIHTLKKVELHWVYLGGVPPRAEKQIPKAVSVVELIADRCYWEPGTSRVFAFCFADLQKLVFDGVGNKERGMFEILNLEYQTPHAAQAQEKERRVKTFGVGYNLRHLSILWTREIWNNYVHLKSHLIEDTLLKCCHLEGVILDEVCAWEEDKERRCKSPLYSIPTAIRRIDLRKCTKRTLKDLLNRSDHWKALRSLKISMIAEEVYDSDLEVIQNHLGGALYGRSRVEIDGYVYRRDGWTLLSDEEEQALKIKLERDDREENKVMRQND